MTDQNQKVLVCFSFRSHARGYIEKLFGRLQTHAATKDLELHRGSLKDIVVHVRHNQLQITESLTKSDIRNFDVIYFQLWRKAPEQALAVARYAEQHAIPYFAKEVASITPSTKFGDTILLSGGAISLPHTFMSSQRETLKAFKSRPPIAFPVVMKSVEGFGGNHNFLVTSYDKMTAICADHPKVQFMVQEFIPNDSDYRCLIMGGKIVLVLKRTRQSDGSSHLNNTSQGADAEVVPLDSLPQPAQDMALEAARLLKRDTFSGVDIMLHANTGQPYVLEANEAPQIEIGAATEAKMDALTTYMQELSRRAQP